MAAAVTCAGIERPDRLGERHGRADHSAQLRPAAGGDRRFTAAGKTRFGHELAAAVRDLGRPTLRASLDDFKPTSGEEVDLPPHLFAEVSKLG